MWFNQIYEKQNLHRFNDGGFNLILLKLYNYGALQQVQSDKVYIKSMHKYDYNQPPIT